MSVVYANNNNFNDLVLKNEKPVLVDFYADWCGPCRMLAPVLDEIAQDHPEYVIVKVNVDESPELASQYGVMSIPALFAFDGGNIIGQSLGVKPKAQLLAMLP